MMFRDLFILVPNPGSLTEIVGGGETSWLISFRILGPLAGGM